MKPAAEQIAEVYRELWQVFIDNIRLKKYSIIKITLKKYGGLGFYYQETGNDFIPRFIRDRTEAGIWTG